MDDIPMILRINAFLQRGGTLRLETKQVDSVALDHYCTFADYSGTQLTDEQLEMLYRLTFPPEGKANA